LKRYVRSRARNPAVGDEDEGKCSEDVLDNKKIRDKLRIPGMCPSPAGREIGEGDWGLVVREAQTAQPSRRFSAILVGLLVASRAEVQHSLQSQHQATPGCQGLAPTVPFYFWNSTMENKKAEWESMKGTNSGRRSA
jgi:hypothetical protein